MVYDLGALYGNNVTNMYQATTKIGVASNNIFGTLLMLTVFIALFIYYRREGTIKDLIASGFISVILGIMLVSIGLLTWSVFFSLIFVFVFVFMLNFFQ